MIFLLFNMIYFSPKAACAWKVWKDNFNKPYQLDHEISVSSTHTPRLPYKSWPDMRRCPPGTTPQLSPLRVPGRQRHRGYSSRCQATLLGVVSSCTACCLVSERSRLLVHLPFRLIQIINLFILQWRRIHNYFNIHIEHNIYEIPVLIDHGL